MEIKGDEVIGLHGQNLSYQELDLLVSLADGLTPSQIATKLNTDTATIMKHEAQIRAKLGAKSKPHMISRGFVLGLLIPRAFCFLLALTAAIPAAPKLQHDIGSRPTRPSPVRTTRQLTRIVRIGRTAGGRQYT